MRAAAKVRVRLTDDEIHWLLLAHRQRIADIFTWPATTPAGRRLAREAMLHHERRIAAFKRIEASHRDVVAEG